MIMGKYVESLAKGDNLVGKFTLSDDTICQYLRAATTWMFHHNGITVPRYTNEGGSKKSEKLHPYINEIIAQQRTWKKAKDKKEPLTGVIFVVMAQLAEQSRR